MKNPKSFKVIAVTTLAVSFTSTGVGIADALNPNFNPSLPGKSHPLYQPPEEPPIQDVDTTIV